MPNAMIERVKDAIVKAATPTDKAKAAIIAMREPTEEMIEEGNIFAHDDDCYNAYRAMIDAALKE